MSSEAVLTYFEGRGRAEVIRLALCMAKIPFKNNFVHKHEEFHKLQDEGKLLFNQLPLLEIDGLRLTQTNAVVRYVGGKGNLIPTDPKDKYRVDVLYEGSRDCYGAFYQTGGLMGADEAEVNTKMEKNLAKYLPIFERELAQTGTGYLVGSSATLADVGFLEVVLATVDFLGESKFDGYPSVQKFLATMRSLPEVVTYMSKVRQRKNDARYNEEVTETLFTPRK